MSEFGLSSLPVRGILPNFLRPIGCSDLIRLGRENDGGYLVCLSDVRLSDLLMSFGISDDWSFERDFKAQSSARILAFDGSVELRDFAGLAVRSLLRLRIPTFIRAFGLAVDFKKVFSGRVAFNKMFVGEQSDSSTVAMGQLLNLEEEGQMMLKIDIEGDEYRILPDIIESRERLSSLVIEFHDVDLHLQRIQDFIRELNFKLIHVHANNFAKVGK